MDLVQAYSNLSDHVERLRALRNLRQAAQPGRPEHRPKQAQRRLGPDAEAVLVATYQAGAKVVKLAAEFGVHRDTVHNILERQGVLRPRGLQPDELLEAIHLYEDNWSLGRLATEFDVSPSTVNRALRQAGVQIRRPGRPSGS